MPLGGLFRRSSNDRRYRRSYSSHTKQRCHQGRNETSTTSLDDIALSSDEYSAYRGVEDTIVKNNCSELTVPHCVPPIPLSSSSSNPLSQVAETSTKNVDPSSGGGGGAGAVEKTKSYMRSYHASVRKKFSNYEDIARLELAPDGYRLTGQQRELVKMYWQQANAKQGPIGDFVFAWISSRCPELDKIFRTNENWDDEDEDADDDDAVGNDEVVKPPRCFQQQQQQQRQQQEQEQQHKHAQAVTALLELVVSSVVVESGAGGLLGGCSAGISLDDTTGPLLHSYGTKHAQIERVWADFQLKTEYWDVFRTAMCEYGYNACCWPNVLSAITTSLSSTSKRNEAVHAWRILVYYVIVKLRRGYEMEKNEAKLRGRGRSFAEDVVKLI